MTSDEGSPVSDYIVRNRESWNAVADEYAEYGERAWEREPEWGIFGISEAEVGLLPDVEGKYVLEDGRGTAYVSAWLARRGASCVGLDSSPAQLATAKRLQQKHDLEFPLIHGIAERLPFRDATFDLVISEYGAALWADPYKWIPEASRTLRRGGSLISLSNGMLAYLTVPDDDDTPADETLKRDYFGAYETEWPDSDGVEFHLGYGDWIRLFRSSGLEVIDLVELRPPRTAATEFEWMSTAWARRWPAEEVWIARKL